MRVWRNIGNHALDRERALLCRLADQVFARDFVATVSRRGFLVGLLLMPALGAAFLLVFILGLREFTIPFVLQSQENLMLPVLVWTLFQSGQPGPSAALGALMIALAVPTLFLLRRYAYGAHE